LLIEDEPKDEKSEATEDPINNNDGDGDENFFYGDGKVTLVIQKSLLT
jgi:hypothetical protein